MSTCQVWKGPILLGAGSITNASATVSSYNRADKVATDSVEVVTGVGRNVTVQITSSTHIGSSFNTRVVTDGATELTLADKNPFAT